MELVGLKKYHYVVEILYKSSRTMYDREYLMAYSDTNAVNQAMMMCKYHDLTKLEFVPKKLY